MTGRPAPPEDVDRAAFPDLATRRSIDGGAASAKFRALLDAGGPVCADGAMGTMLFANGLQFGDPPEVWNLAHPDVIRRIQRAYIDAGSQILLTNTFGGNRARLKLSGHADSVDELNRTAAILLRAEVDAAGGHALVAGDIGPSGEIVEPLGTLPYAEAVDIFHEQAASLIAGGVDLIWIETMSDLNEIKAAIEGVRRASPSIALIATMTFDTRGHTMMGVTPEQAVAALDAWGADAVGGNCGNGPGRADPGHREDARRATRRRAGRQVECRDARARRHARRVPRGPGHDGRPGARDARGRGHDRRRLLREHARPPAGDRRGRRGRRLMAGRPLKVGVQLPEVEREVRWPELLDMIRAIEDLGFDSIWLGEHLLYRWEGRPARGPWEAWSLMAAIAATTSRVEFGPFVACTSFHNPALLAKQAATIDEISGGRFILGLGAGWNETEFKAFGFPYDHRVDRFEEAFTIIRTLLAEGAIDFDGRFYQARDCELLPRGPRPGGPPLLIGSNGPRMLRIALPHADAWNTWYADIGNTPAGIAPLRAVVDEACRDVGRDPAAIERTVAVLVGLPGGTGRVSGDATPGRDPAADRGSGGHGRGLRAYAREGIGTVQLVLDPITVPSIQAVAKALAELDRG